jgi:hypothetical protein
MYIFVKGDAILDFEYPCLRVDTDMTAQFHDLFRHQNQEFSVVSAGELFAPASFGLFPIPASTACWRGNLALYTIRDAQLVLDRLYVNLRELQGPMINGVTPQPPADRYGMFNNTYGNLNLPIPYSGSMLIGSGFIRELYEHMGFHPAWKYGVVIELMFENGKWKGETDRSESMAELRRTMQEKRK